MSRPPPLPVAHRARSPSPPVRPGYRAVNDFKFRATARGWMALPSVGENGCRGVVKVHDWPAWRIRAQAIKKQDLPTAASGGASEADATCWTRVSAPELRALHWDGRGCDDLCADASVAGIPRLIAESGSRSKASTPRRWVW